jgi:hypothetical protein
MCSWETSLNTAYYRDWPNYTFLYGGVFNNSNTALSQLPYEVGLSTRLPVGAPNLPGWGQGFTSCGGVGSPNMHCGTT